MPRYVYQCPAEGCKDAPSFEEERKIAERNELVPCPICQTASPRVQVPHRPGGFVLNGGGWYKDGYRGS